MCRYGFKSYKIHYACFDCRKVFRRPSPWDLMAQDGVQHTYQKLTDEAGARNSEELAALEARYFARAQVCPDCRRPLANVGMDLRAPKRTDVKQWKVIASMYRMGHAFQTCGCNGPGYIPSTPTDHRRYLEQRRDEYRDRMASADSAEQATYWAERVALVEREQAVHRARDH